MNIFFKLGFAFTIMLTPFFYSFSADFKAPDIETGFDCAFIQSPPTYSVGFFENHSECGAALASAYDALWESHDDASIRKGSSFDRNEGSYIYISYTKCVDYNYSTSSCNSWSSDSTEHVGYLNDTPSIVASCPPEEYPNYLFGKDTDGDDNIDSCHLSSLDSCPLGSYAYQVGGECIPVQCEAAGSGGSLWAKGDTYSNNAGTYCDGSCAHTVAGGQNNSGSTGNVAIYGVSTGQSCGQGTDFSMHDGDGSDCQVLDVGTGTNYLSCSNVAEKPEPELPLDLESEEFVLAEMQELIPIQETCPVGDSSCEIRNLKESTFTENAEQKELAVELHNKNIKAQEISTQTLVDTLVNNSTQQTQGLEILNDAIKNLNENGFGSGGGGGYGEEGLCDIDGNCTTTVETKTEPAEGLEGFWVSDYEDGLEGIFEDQLVSLQSSEFYLFLDNFNPSISGGSAPDMSMCFNLGFINFGCHSFDIDPRVYPAIRIFILISAAFLCRRILFGG
jgi:hypothetical protein